MKTRVYKEALGIQVGDIITTSYDTGPYEVWHIWGPKYWHKGLDWIIWPWPVISLLCVYAPGHHFFGRRGFSYLNEIHQENDRWFMPYGEIFIASPVGGYPDLPMDMFLNYAPSAEPYPFQDGVDYIAWAWHCRGCGLDFNEVRDDHSPPLCPNCQYIASTRLIMVEAGRHPCPKC